MDAATRQALDAFFDANERRAYLMAKTLVGNREDALDLVQESMLRLVNRYRRHDAADWGPLFHRILQNAIRDHLRRRRVRRLFADWWRPQETSAAPRAADEQAAGDAELARIQRALDGLPLRQRQVFLLRAWQEYSTRETAAALGISENSVKTHFARANHSLRQQLGENHE